MSGTLKQITFIQWWFKVNWKMEKIENDDCSICQKHCYSPGWLCRPEPGWKLLAEKRQKCDCLEFRDKKLRRKPGGAALSWLERSRTSFLRPEKLELRKGLKSQPARGYMSKAPAVWKSLIEFRPKFEGLDWRLSVPGNPSHRRGSYRTLRVSERLGWESLIIPSLRIPRKQPCW